MSDAISAQGTLIRFALDPLWPPDAPIGTPIGAPSTWTIVAELNDIKGPERSRKQIETTTHNQDVDRFIVGILRRSEVTFAVNWIPTDPTLDHNTGIDYLVETGKRAIFDIEFPDGTQFLFSGFCTNIGQSAPVDDKLTADVTLRPTAAHKWIDPA